MNTNFYTTALFLKNGDVLLMPDNACWADLIRLRPGRRHVFGLNGMYLDPIEVHWRGSLVHVPTTGSVKPYNPMDLEVLEKLPDLLSLRRWPAVSRPDVYRQVASMCLHAATLNGPWHPLTPLALINILRATPPVVAPALATKELAHVGD